MHALHARGMHAACMPACMIHACSAGMHSLEGIGESLKRKEQTTPKDEDVFFVVLVTQIKQLKPEVKLVVKMEIHNLLYLSTYWHTTQLKPNPPITCLTQ